MNTLPNENRKRLIKKKESRGNTTSGLKKKITRRFQVIRDLVGKHTKKHYDALEYYARLMRLAMFYTAVMTGHYDKSVIDFSKNMSKAGNVKNDRISEKQIQEFVKTEKDLKKNKEKYADIIKSVGLTQSVDKLYKTLGMLKDDLKRVTVIPEKPDSKKFLHIKGGIIEPLKQDFYDVLEFINRAAKARLATEYIKFRLNGKDVVKRLIPSKNPSGESGNSATNKVFYFGISPANGKDKYKKLRGFFLTEAEKSEGVKNKEKRRNKIEKMLGYEKKIKIIYDLDSGTKHSENI